MKYLLSITNDEDEVLFDMELLADDVVRLLYEKIANPDEEEEVVLPEPASTKKTKDAKQRRCGQCNQPGHIKRYCPVLNGPQKVVDSKESASEQPLTEMEYADVREKFREIGTTKDTAADMNLPLAEVNRAVSSPTYDLYTRAYQQGI